jgi:hypothetical protein
VNPIYLKNKGRVSFLKLAKQESRNFWQDYVNITGNPLTLLNEKDEEETLLPDGKGKDFKDLCKIIRERYGIQNASDQD